MGDTSIYTKKVTALANLDADDNIKNKELITRYTNYKKGVDKSIGDDAVVKERKHRYIGNRRAQAALIRQMRRDDQSGYQKQKNAIAAIHEALITEHIVAAEEFWVSFIGLKKSDAEEMVAREAEILEDLYDFRFKAIFDTEPYEDGKHVDMVVQ